MGEASLALGLGLGRMVGAGLVLGPVGARMAERPMTIPVNLQWGGFG